MNKYLFILGFVGTALFTACSTSDDLTAEETPVTPVEEPKETTLVVEARQNSEIPITLGAGSGRAMTRAPFDNETDEFSTPYDSDDPSKNRYIGVFCLATGYQPLYEANPPIENNWTNNDATGLIMRMKNVPAIVENSSVRFPNIPSLSTANPLADVYYYPMGNWMKYNFYAYYPWQNEELNNKTLTFKNNRVLEKYYEINGSQDIIWGMANPSDATPLSSAATDAKPYSSKYFRLRKKEIEEAGTGDIAADYPKLKFEHKLVQFRFFVKAANSTVLSDLTAKHLQVTDMYIGNAINRLELVVADQSAVYDGELFWFGNSVRLEEMRIKTNGADTDRFDQVSPFVDDEDDDDDDLNLDNPLDITVDAVDVTTEDPVGYIMLAPPSIPSFNATFSNNPSEDPGAATANLVYQLYMKVKYDNGSGGTDTNMVASSLNPPQIPDSDPEEYGFEAGKIYNIVVNVQSPEQISAKAILQAWKPWDKNNDGVIDNNDVIEYNN